MQRIFKVHACCDIYQYFVLPSLHKAEACHCRKTVTGVSKLLVMWSLSFTQVYGARLLKFKRCSLGISSLG